MSRAGEPDAMLTHLDDATRGLVRLSCVLAAGAEDDMRAALQSARSVTPPEWIEELILQTHLFAGFPRALNAMREWRRITGRRVSNDAAQVRAADAAGSGERTCARVYGVMYARLRENIRELHPALDEWMIVAGYGTVLSRSALDLGRRELCIVAACAATAQDRQLQSHLHGARNVGVPADVITATLDAIRGLVPAAALARAERLWARIR